MRLKLGKSVPAAEKPCPGGKIRSKLCHGKFPDRSMKAFFFPVFVLSLVLCHFSLAVDWDAIVKAPPEITVLLMKPKKLEVNEDKIGWVRVPAMFSDRNAVIYIPENEHLGAADIQVMSDGYLFLACNWDYQGNQSGDWATEAWDEKKFESEGWKKLTKEELGGELIRNNNRVQKVFVKLVKQGEKFRLRSNKYDPPYPILLNHKPTAILVTAPPKN